MQKTTDASPRLRRKPKMNGYPDPSVVLARSELDALDLSGKRMLVVGGTDGLGRAIAKVAAERGAEVVVVGRTFREQGTARLSFEPADLASMAEASRLGRTVDPAFDIVLLTAGIMTAKAREETKEGIERDLAISALSRRAILRELMPRLAPKDGRRARIFVMGFPGAGELGTPDDLNAERTYDPFKQHMNTVALNEALVLDTAERFPASGVFGLNPGLIKTNIRANYMGDGSLMHRVSEFFIGLFMQSPEAYARRVVPLLVAPELERRSGVMFGAKAQPILPTDGMDATHARALVSAADALLERAHPTAHA